MNVVHAIILGIVEGITEFLPISSTGHLILTGRILGLTQTEFLKTFEISIQLGAIASVVVLYFRSFFLSLATLKRIVVAFIPTAILGLIFYQIIKTYLLSSYSVVLWALFLGGIFLIGFEWLFASKELKQDREDDLAKLSYGKALLIGVFQSIAMIPGVSRSAATILGGLSLGISRKAIVEFSFLLAVPTMMAATGLDLINNANTFSMDQLVLLSVGFITAFIVAILSIKFFLKYIQHHTFVAFGVYRIVVAVLFFLVFVK